MRVEEMLILRRSDLTEPRKGKNIEDITLLYFDSPLDIFRHSNIIMFIDDNSEIKILKDRYNITKKKLWMSR